MELKHQQVKRSVGGLAGWCGTIVVVFGEFVDVDGVSWGVEGKDDKRGWYRVRDRECAGRGSPGGV